MGNYTIRTSEQDDVMIKEAQEFIGAATASKAFLTAVAKYKEHKETIAKLERELAAERRRVYQMSTGIKAFEESMTTLFSLK